MKASKVLLHIVGIVIVVLASHKITHELDRLGNGPKIRAMEYKTIESHGELLFVSSSLSSTFASNCVMDNFNNTKIIGPYLWKGDLICGNERYEGITVSIDMCSRKPAVEDSGYAEFKKDEHVFDHGNLNESFNSTGNKKYAVVGKTFRVDIDFGDVLKFPKNAEIVIIAH